MGRKSHSNYVTAAIEILQELGGGPIATKDLVSRAQERGLVNNTGKWAYHNMTAALRKSEAINTTEHGQVSLAVELPGTGVNMSVPRGNFQDNLRAGADPTDTGRVSSTKPNKSAVPQTADTLGDTGPISDEIATAEG